MQFYLLWHTISFVIDTPAKYDQFKRGVIGQEREVIHIESSAAAYVFSEVKYFFNSTNHLAIRFNDKIAGSITLFPREEKVVTSFWSGTNLARHLPHHYKHYELSYNYRAIISAADLTQIFEFIEAETLQLGKGFDVKIDLATRIAEMKRLTKLHTLRVDIKPEFSDSQVKAFLEIPPSVTFISLDLPVSMTPQEAARFAKNQKVPSSWELNYNHHLIQLVKVRGLSDLASEISHQNYLFD